MRIVARLAPDRRGNTMMLFAGALGLLLGVMALGIDAGTVFVAKRRLQGVADAAALAAANDADHAAAAAGATIAANAAAAAELRALTPGNYAPDETRSPEARFSAGGTGTNAVRVELTATAPTFFARALGFTAVPIQARATAARIPLAAISIGSRVAALSGGLVNRYLSELAGAELGLSLLDYNALVGTRVELLRFSDALRTELNLQGMTFEDVLATRTTLPAVARALAASTDGAGAAALRTLAGRLPGTPVRLSDLLDLGPLGERMRIEGAMPVAVDAASLLRAVLEASDGSHQLTSDVDLGVPGIATASVRVAIGARPSHSPWLAVGQGGDVTVRTAQTRLLADLRVGALLPAGLGQLRVPILVELASAEARLDSIRCRGAAVMSVGVTATPSLGKVALAETSGDFDDLRHALTLRPATIVRAPLTSVTGFSEIALGNRPRALTFTADDIAAHRSQTVSTDDVARGVARSLIERVQLRVNALGLGLDLGGVTAIVGAALGVAAGPLDAALAQVFAIAGLSVGQAEVWVDGARCGAPVLVG